jgi:glycosyltransferase involved in cell wall biosynthesis
MTAEGINFRSWKRKSFSQNLYVNYALKRLDPADNYRKVFEASVALKADIYHFHDLWLNRIAPDLKKLPHRPVVMYDVREPHADDYRSFYGKSWFSHPVVKAFSAWVDRWEKRKAKGYDLVIATEPIVRSRFVPSVGEQRAVVISNFPDQEVWEGLTPEAGPRSGTLDRAADRSDRDEEQKVYDLIYCGMLTEARGAFNILESIDLVREKHPAIKLLLLGRIDPPSLKDGMFSYIRENQLEDNVEIKGQVPFQQVGTYYRKSRIGLILWNPLANLKIKMPIKLFEYMAFGLPVIGSDFGHIREYIDREKCGLTVDPGDAEAVAKAIGGLLAEGIRYQQMSRIGLDAAREKYNWKPEFERLCVYYRKALDERTDRNG